jgi:DNA polymerase-3 subunit gamma/tau
VDAPLALYRRYRPDTFRQVIGQDHVTDPLRAALRNNRVNHAYLFSGPRGCGKTTSARILARALNCAEGPTDEPCGSCESCIDLATGGPGSVDVIEIDAASHGRVEDTRDLREQATFQPMRDRYKVYIIDEAHMVTTQGFNALLKIVEEPPEHVRFIFATTEPEKVIGTIRSRTHHYPFRLIPPKTLTTYLDELCAREGVAVEAAALPLVVRAGGGSARDTLSVLDQLIGGAGDDGVTYRLASALLGFTPDSLLDEVVDGFAAQDGAAVFGVVDKVIETGQDPRRFTEDLLQRLRDLVIISAVPDASATGLIDVTPDQGERLVAQAARFGRHELSRAADLVAEGLMELKGTTAPRLLLELLCARVLLPGADDTTRGLAARMDRVEKRMSMAPAGPLHEDESTPGPAAPPVSAAAAPADGPSAPPPSGQRVPRQSEVAPAPAEALAGAEAPVGGAATVEPARAASSSSSSPAAGGRPSPSPSTSQPSTSQPSTSQPGATTPVGALTLVDVRRLWPEVVEAVKSRRRVTWIQLSQHAQVVALEGSTLTVGFNNAGARESFANGRGDLILQQALIDLVGQDWRIDAIVDPAARPGTEPTHTVTRPSVPPTSSPTGPSSGASAPQGGGRAPTTTGPASSEPTDRPASERPGPDWSTSEPATSPPDWATSDPAPAEPTARAGSGATVSAEQTSARARAVAAVAAEPSARPDGQAGMAVDALAHRDDPDLEDVLDGAELLSQRLGAQVIEEIPHD